MKTVFITGGATGIGAATVAKFVAEGWCVAFIDIDTEAAASLVESLDAPDRVLFVEADTRSRAAIERAVDAAVERFGHIDSVFANAGIHQSNTLLTVTDDDLDRIIAINIRGTVDTLRVAVPRLIDAGGGSVVINCSDQWFVGKPRNFAYGLTKGALGQITRSLSIDLARYGIRVNAVCPGSIHTPLLDKALERASAASGAPLEDLYREEDALFARGSMGRPEEVAEMVYFLASDASAFCTGAHYLIDGGLCAG